MKKNTTTFNSVFNPRIEFDISGGYNEINPPIIQIKHSQPTGTPFI